MTGRNAAPGAWRFWMSDYEAVLGLTVVLVLVGSLNVFSSSFVVAGTNYDDPYFFLRKQGINILVGIAFGLAGAFVDYHVWIRFRKPILYATFLLLGLVFIAGVEVNGARRWLAFGSVQVQPAEFAKLTAIFLEAHYIAWRVRLGMRCLFWHDAILLVGALGLMVEREPDMGTASIVWGVPLLMMLCSNMKGGTKLRMMLAGLLGGAVLCAFQPYRLTRVLTMLNPWADAQGSGYQIVQSLQAIGSGGFFGMGLGMGVSKYHYLPEAHTDFAFAVWCQETGYAGAAVVLLLLAMFAYHGCRIAVAARDALGQTLALGMTLLIAVQAIINLLMISGLFPVVGVPLPFISYGGTSLFVSLFAVGVLVNIGRKNMGGKQAAAAPNGTGKKPARPRLRRVK